MGRLRVEEVSKRYCRTFRRGVFYLGLDLAGGILGRPERTGLRPGEFWALSEVSFEVDAGRSLGIIGANGAGKSSLLKILTGIIEPTSGRVWRQGRIGSLIELGAGFHPDLGGRDNIYVYGSILGMRRTEIDRSFDSIVAFSGLADFLDMPVRFYSSGMYVRLAFSVAAHTEPDVLLVDEVLAVGDLAFRRRCMEHFRSLLERGCAVVLVSHDPGLIEAQCDEVILLEKGRIAGRGLPGEMLDLYRSERRSEGPPGFSALDADATDAGLRILDVVIRPGQGPPGHRVALHDRAAFEIHYEAERRIEEPLFNLAILDESGRQLTACRTDLAGHRIPYLAPGRGSVVLEIERMLLLPGNYLLSVRISRSDPRDLYCTREGAWALQVLGGHRVFGVFELPYRWTGPDRVP